MFFLEANFTQDFYFYFSVCLLMFFFLVFILLLLLLLLWISLRLHVHNSLDYRILLSSSFLSNVFHKCIYMRGTRKINLLLFLLRDIFFSSVFFMWLIRQTNRTITQNNYNCLLFLLLFCFVLFWYFMFCWNFNAV